MDRLNQTPIPKGRPVSTIDAAKASDAFEHFISASTIKTIIGYYRNICELIHLKPNVFPLFYPKLRANLNSWKAKALWKKFDSRASHKCYARGKACPNTRVLIIGAGPCGLRTAIEAQLLGAKVVVIEKRDRMSRNNVLHLWPFVIEDLRALGAKKFFGKFCAGAIDHISIRQLQCILFKVALLIGVEIHTEVSFERLIEPSNVEKTGWRAEFKPADHPVSQYEFDVVIGADGKRNTLQGFKRKEFRGKLAIAITANFINKRTEAEARVEEISGVAFIFNQKFFKELNADTGIDLENIVYYKDDTHYFVMTAKKPSLIDKGVIKHDYPDTAKLLSPDNVDREALLSYAREAADFSTNYQMPDVEFAVNHYGQPDVAMFDFTSMYAAENASKVVERCGYKLLMILVGDSLLEPFWPTGSGCARGFLSALDACWAIKAWGSGLVTPLEVLAERESIYRLLAQTTPENLNKDCKSYTVDPSTRYPNLNRAVLVPQQVLSLYDSDDPNGIELTSRNPVPVSSNSAIESHRKRRRRDTHLDPNTLISWIKGQIKDYNDLVVEDITTSFRDGRVLCAIIHHYRPDLLDYSAVKAEDVAKNNQQAFDLLEKELGISPVMTGEDMANSEVPDYLTMFSYLTQIYDTFRGEIPHIKHLKLKPCEMATPTLSNPKNSPKNNKSKMQSLKTKTKVKSVKVKSLLEHTNNTKSIPMKKSKSRKAFKSKLKKSHSKISNFLCMPVTLESIPDRTRIQNTHFSTVILPEFLSSQENFLNTLNCHGVELSLNLAPIKSLEEYDNKKISRDYQEVDYDSEEKLAHRKLINECELPEVHYFDENFQKIELIQDVSQFVSFPLSDSEPSHINVRCIEESSQSVSVQEVRYCSHSNTVVINKSTSKFNKYKNQVRFKSAQNKQPTSLTLCHKNHPKFLMEKKFSSLSDMSVSGDVRPEATYERIVSWINLNDLNNTLDNCTDSSLASNRNSNENIVNNNKEFKVEDNTSSNTSQSNVDEVKDMLKFDHVTKFSKSTPWDCICKKCAQLSDNFSKFAENEETDMSESKDHVKDREPIVVKVTANHLNTAVINRNVNRSKRHSEVAASVKPSFTAERKTKKRKSIEKYELGLEERRKRLEEITANRADRQYKRREQRRKQTDQFIKSMQMLQTNAKSDSSGPFEDYSLFVYRQTAPQFQDRVKNLEKQFTYIPDRDNRLPSQSRGVGADEEIAAKIKEIEDKWQEPYPVDKKPKGLMRAIGKIETSDWNIKEIEKKIMENKLGKSSANREKERVPKWNREQFLARQTKMEKKHLDRQNSAEAKFSEIDKSLKHLEQRLKEGSVRDLGQNKVATITDKLATHKVEPEAKPVQKSNSKAAVILPIQNAPEFCHFCEKRVYLMERLSTEGRFFHRGCFKCQYCHTVLRLGSYLFDREGRYGHRFYCSQHFGMMGELDSVKVLKKYSQKSKESEKKSLEKLKIAPLTGVEGVDLLDRVQTPERIEFANLSAGHISSDHDESLSQMDEDEWTDRNFGASTAEICSSDEDEDSSSLSGSESENEDAFEEALEEPPTKEGTMRWMERYKQRYSKERARQDDSDSEEYSSSSDHSSYYENSSGDDEDGPVTEGEEEIRARELRKQEVRVEPPVVQTDTGSDTEIVSDETSSESSSKHNSATEISTDSEFAVDDPTPTREIPSIIFNDIHVTKTRGNYGPPKRVQVKSGVLQSPLNGKPQKKGIKLEFTPLVPSPVFPKPAPVSSLARTEGYALNRTQSTGGIATKVSLELKKKYLLGDNGISGNIQKSGSVSALDSKFKSFHTNITDCQKLLKPALDINVSNKGNEHKSPLSPIISQSAPFSDQSSKSPDLISPNIQPVKEESIPCIDLTASPEPSNTITTDNNSEFKYESEGRPRSPVKEIPIVVPKIDWSQVNKTKNDEISSDSLTSDSDSNELIGLQKSPTVKLVNSIPRVEVHDDAGEILPNWDDNLPLDSLNPVPSNEKVIEKPLPPDSLKSIASDKKVLNQPKILPDLKKNQYSDIEKKCYTSGHSTPSDHDPTNAALTETELSDWARDGTVSDDFEDVAFEINPIFTNSRKNKLPKSLPLDQGMMKAQIEEFDDVKHICGKEKEPSVRSENSPNGNLNNLLSSLEFMDTGEETSSDEKVLVEATLQNNGYIEFQNEDEITEDSLNPHINQIIETINPDIQEKINLENLSTHNRNTGYCIIGNEEFNFGGKVTELKEDDLEKMKKIQTMCENEEDSLLIVETGTTTEENTCSDSTVKNVLQVSEKDKKDIQNVSSLINENNMLLNKICEKKLEDGNQNIEIKDDYKEHCQRLQSKIEFGNARDSIDIRKSKRKEKSDLPAKPDLIQEEPSGVLNQMELDLTTPQVPKVSYTKAEIQKVRDENQRLVQEMVMNKMKAQNRSLERKKRNRNSFSPNRSFDLNKSATIDISMALKNSENEKRMSAYSETPTLFSPPDVLSVITPQAVNNYHDVSRNNQNQYVNNETYSTTVKQHPKAFSKQLSVHSSFQVRPSNKPATATDLNTNSESSSLPDIQRALINEGFKTPSAVPRLKNLEIQRTTEKLKQDARARLKLKSNEDLGLSPEEKLMKLRERINKRTKEKENIDVHIQDSIESLVINTEKRNSLLYSNDTLKKKRNNSFHRSKSGENMLYSNAVGSSSDVYNNQNCNEVYTARTKSVSELSYAKCDPKLVEIRYNPVDEDSKNYKLQYCKSDPNLLTETCNKAEKKVKKGSVERRKSISKLISEFFGKKKDGQSSTSKGFLARISPKSKSKEKAKQEIKRTTSLSGFAPRNRQIENASPPPIPPLPLNYTGEGFTHDHSSDGENEWKRRSSCDTLDQSCANESRRGSKTLRRASRQAQLKRHRLAQEIQRKLEETEVKTKELEERGVIVEKALRGEIAEAQSSKEECDLLKQWFDLMRDLTELRRYERELTVRAEELELEDRHARLQQELRERLDNDEHKTKADVKVESNIISEMMEIVAKRDSLIALLEEDRIRYSEEDRDFEEQMLAKGLRLTPLQKTVDK